MTPPTAPNERPNERRVVPRLSWRHSLRFRLTLWYSGTLALILIGAAFAVFAGAQHTLQAETDGFLASEAQHITATLAGTPGFAPDPDDVRLAMDTLGPPHNPLHSGAALRFDVVYARLVLQPGGNVLAISPDLARRPALIALLDPPLRRDGRGGRFAFVGPDMDGALRVLTLPVTFDGQAGRLQVAAPWVHNDDLLDRLCVLLALAIPLILLLTTLGGWALIRHTLQPISRIVVEAERLDVAALPRALLPDAVETDSEIGSLVVTLNRMTTRLHEAFEGQRRLAEAQRGLAQAQQRFAADASHELRTPLAILRGEIELSLSSPRTPQAYRETLESAVEEIARMSRIVEGLSFLARQDAGTLGSPLPAEEVDLSEIGGAVAREFLLPARQRQVTLHHEPAEREHGVIVSGNIDQLLQLVRNLVDNALKYTPPGGDVTVTCSSEDGEAVLQVSDTGVGIAAGDIPRIFDRFWRADPSRAGEGSGLGLAICADIARAHGGRLEARSRLGAGTSLTLRLPRADSDTSDSIHALTSASLSSR